MKRKALTAALSAVLALSMTVPAFAAIWKLDPTINAWRYDLLGRGHEDGFARSQWMWIDSDYNGVSECYYFNDNGYMAANTVIDGYTLNENGQWVVDGIIQTRTEGQPVVTGAESKSLLETEPAELAFGSMVESNELANGLVWENALILSGSKTHATYASYNLDGKQKTGSITFAPAGGQSNVPAATTARVSVTSGTTGKSLYRSELFNVNKEPVTVTFNCVNESNIHVNVIRGFDVVFKDISVQY